MVAWLERLLPAGAGLLLGIFAAKLLTRLVLAALRKTKLEKSAYSLLAPILRWTLYVLVGLTVISWLGIDVTGIVALAGVLTLAISLAVQNALTNVMGGITVLYTKPFTAGDFVEIAGRSGTVREVGLTYTKLATADNKIVFLPNSEVVSAEIVNFSASGTRRVDICVSAAWDVPAERVLQALLEAGSVPTVLEEPAPFAGVEGYEEGVVRYVLQLWCLSGDYWTTLFAANRALQEAFCTYEIAVAAPHIHVHTDFLDDLTQKGHTVCGQKTAHSGP